MSKLRWVLILGLGYLWGWILPPFDIKSQTYFEANEVAHLIYKQRPDSFLLSDVYGNDWELACLGGRGNDMVESLQNNRRAVHRFSEKFSANDTFTFLGINVDEGLLDYIFKIVLINEDRQVYINNFDDRLFWFQGGIRASGCAPPEQVRVSVTYDVGELKRTQLQFEVLEEFNQNNGD